MLEHWINKKSLAEIHKAQSELRYNKKSKILYGHLYFNATGGPNEITLEDCYNIGIHFKTCKPFPLVKEIGTKIQKIAEYKNKFLEDLHVSKDNALCLCGRFRAYEMYKEINSQDNPLLGFIAKLVIPFLFGVTYFKKYNEWPFGELTHGIEGLVQEAVENPKLYQLYLDQYNKDYSEESDQFFKKYLKGYTKKNE